MNVGRMGFWAVLWLAAGATAARAGLVFVEYIDINPPTSTFPNAGGPHWTGFVNTTTNTLTIETWVEIPGSVAFWTPFWTPDLTVLPLVWPAVNSNGDEYDVPDDFNGTINANWAFISPVSARNMKWNEGTFSFPEVADFYPGWGGARRPLVGQNPVQLIYDTSADQHSMPFLPSFAFGYSASTGATVNIALGSTPESVPEASAFLFGAVAIAAAALGVRWRRLRAG